MTTSDPLSSPEDRRPVRVLGAPIDYGTSRRGVDMGPSAIRYAGLTAAIEGAGRPCEDAGDLAAPNAAAEDPGDPDARYLGAVESVTTDLADRVADALLDSRPVVLGGDHSVAIGSLAGSARDATVGVVWFDAHGDLNDPGTTPTGNVHGMPLAAALGIGEFADTDWARAPGLAPENVALVGLRDVDAGERARIDDLPVAAFTMSEIDERGIAAVVDDALAAATSGTDGVHVSLDLDWLDPTHAPGVGTPVRGGVTYREAHAAMERVAGDALRSLDLVEVNPILDSHNQTAELAVELAASALGKRVL